MKEGPEIVPGPVPKPRGMSDFRKAFIWTAVPLVALAVFDFVLGLLNSYLWRSGISGMFLISLRFPLAILWVAALFTAVAFAIARRRQIAAGMLAGVAIGFVAVGLTCFGSFVPLG